LISPIPTFGVRVGRLSAALQPDQLQPSSRPIRETRVKFEPQKPRFFLSLVTPTDQFAKTRLKSKQTPFPYGEKRARITGE
jgi:hypothetical protein